MAESDDVERYLMQEVDAGLSQAESSVMGVIAALLGHGVTRDAIEAVLDGGSLRRELHALSERYLLIMSEGEANREYRQHAIVQAFYYEQLSKRERQALHGRAAAYYEHEERDPLRAAIHYERAGEYTRAAELATADVWALINKGQSKALCDLLERCTTRHLEPELRGAVQVALGAAYPYTGEIDLARDGALDLVVGNSENDPNQIYLGKGNGTFVPPATLPDSSGSTYSVELGDLNDDEVLDLVLGNWDAPSQVYLGKGDGKFAAPTELPGSGSTYNMALGDLNGDGALDLVSGNYSAFSSVYLGKGDGSFAAPIPSSSPGSLRI